MKEIALVLLGALLTLIPIWFDRRRSIKGHFLAIRAELQICLDRANIFLNDNIKSPLYRLPLTAYSVAVPILIRENVLSEEESKILARFYGQAEDINRGLDYAATSKGADLDNQVNRLILKTKELAVSEENKKSLYEEAKELVDNKIAIPIWRY